MLTSLHITGFRGLKQLELENSGRVNLIVGRNDTGKTTVLEAVRLLLTGDPRHLRRPNRNRHDRRSMDIDWYFRLAFYCLDANEPIHVEGAIGDLLLSARAKIREIVGQQELPFDISEDDVSDESPESLLQPGREVVVEVTANNSLATLHAPMYSRERYIGRTFREIPEGFPEIPPVVWLGTNRAEAWAHASRYSALFRSGGSDLLLEVLRQIEPHLEGLVVLTESDEMLPSRAVLEVDIGADYLLPLESMGDGFSSTISIVSAIGSARNGLCLIDEVENGIHYSLLPGVWRAAASAAERFGTQLWATTHSYDCLLAVQSAFADRPDDLRVHRLERKEGGQVVAHTFDYSMLGRAIERGLEVR